MPLKDGSIGWLVATQAALHLDNFARIIESTLQAEEPLSDEEFALVISYSLTYGGVSPVAKNRPLSIGLGEILLDWPHGKNLPTEEVRKILLRWIASELQKEVEKIKPLVG